MTHNLDWITITEELRKPLAAGAVRPPAPGKFGEYVDGKHVIDEANRIFGHEGWSYTVTRLEQVSEQTVDTPKGPQYRVGYLCAVRVNVDGVEREGLAVGSGVGKPDTMADHHESAVKEAETDALKRALRSFGNTFGLALYERDKAKREVAQPSRWEGVSRDMIAAMKTHGVQNVTSDPKFQNDIGAMRKEAPEIAARVDAEIETLTQAEAA